MVTNFNKSTAVTSLTLSLACMLVLALCDHNIRSLAYR